MQICIIRHKIQDAICKDPFSIKVIKLVSTGSEKEALTVDPDRENRVYFKHFTPDSQQPNNQHELDGEIISFLCGYRICHGILVILDIYINSSIAYMLNINTSCKCKKVSPS